MHRQETIDTTVPLPDGRERASAPTRWGLRIVNMKQCIHSSNTITQNGFKEKMQTEMWQPRCQLI